MPMSPMFRVIFFLLLVCSGTQVLGENSGENFFELCQATRCGKKGPIIRYPFRLNSQPSFCGREGFELSCSGDNTLLRLPFSGNYYIQQIIYTDATISIMHVNDTKCPLQSLLSLNLSDSQFYVADCLDQFCPKTFTVVNCTEKDAWAATDETLVGPIDCIGDDKILVYVTDAYASMDKLPSPCRTYQTAEIVTPSRSDLRRAIERLLRTREIFIQWLDSGTCVACEKSGNHCGFNATGNETICSPNRQRSHGPIIIGTSVGGTIFLALVTLFFYLRRKSDKEKETQLKIERFLANYKTLNPTRYTYTDVKKITSGFKHKLGQGGYGSVYQGKLTNGVPVAVKMIENSVRNGEEFTNEVATIGRIHHFNVVRLLGFCSEGTRRALIYEFMPNKSLEKFIFSKEARSTHRLLSWQKLQQIAIGIAHGIEYLHQGCNQRILHFDIKPHNILLDHNLQPKISDFGLAKLCSKDQSIVSMTAARGTAGYIAPELFSRNFGGVSHKSDVYSFGMLLLEMVGCRKNIDPMVENHSQIYFPEWIYDRMIQERELGLEVEVDGDEDITKKLAIVALWCIQWSPTDRPSMTMVVQMLEGDLKSLKIPPKPFVSSDAEVGAA